MYRYFYVFIIIFYFYSEAEFIHASESEEQFQGFPLTNQYFVSLGRTQGRTVGNEYSYNTVSLLAFPYSTQVYCPFINLRFHGFDKSGRVASNLGIGVRVAPQSIDQVLGINAFYDFKKVHRGRYNQMGLGLESLGCTWNFRFNGYLPFGKKKFLHSYCYAEEDGYFNLREDFIESLSGFNFEVEANLANFCCTEIFLAMGGYYYKDEKRRGNIYGTEYRLSTQLNETITFSLNATHDCRYKTRIQAQLFFTIPLPSCSITNAQFFEPVRRFDMIVLDKRSLWTWNY